MTRFVAVALFHLEAQRLGLRARASESESAPRSAQQGDD